MDGLSELSIGRGGIGGELALVINNPNPLLVVNHRTNVVANPGRTQPVATTVIEGAHASRVMSGSLAFGLQGASL